MSGEYLSTSLNSPPPPPRWENKNMKWGIGGKQKGSDSMLGQLAPLIEDEDGEEEKE